MPKRVLIVRHKLLLRFEQNKFSDVLLLLAEGEEKAKWHWSEKTAKDQIGKSLINGLVIRLDQNPKSSMRLPNENSLRCQGSSTNSCRMVSVVLSSTCLPAIWRFTVFRLLFTTLTFVRGLFMPIKSAWPLLTGFYDHREPGSIMHKDSES